MYFIGRFFLHRLGSFHFCYWVVFNYQNILDWKVFSMTMKFNIKAVKVNKINCSTLPFLKNTQYRVSKLRSFEEKKVLRRGWTFLWILMRRGEGIFWRGRKWKLMSEPWSNFICAILKSSQEDFFKLKKIIFFN
jgi:hypothetical protein